MIQAFVKAHNNEIGLKKETAKYIAQELITELNEKFYRYKYKHHYRCSEGSAIYTRRIKIDKMELIKKYDGCTEKDFQTAIDKLIEAKVIFDFDEETGIVQA